MPDRIHIIRRAQKSLTPRHNNFQRSVTIQNFRTVVISVASTRLLLFSVSLQVSEPYNKLLLISAL